MRWERVLSGHWQFGLDPQGEKTVETLVTDREITVPLPWQAAFPELEQYSGYAWYRCGFDLEETWLAGDLLLTFGAVDYWCQVFINGQQVGEHEGGYTPFTFSIREAANVGQNDLAVRVYDSAQTHINTPRWPAYQAEAGKGGPPFDPEMIPHGKQEWYINVGGIWQDVTLTAVPHTYIERVHITPDIHTGQARIEVELAGDVAAMTEGTLQVQLAGEGASEPVALALIPGQAVYETTVQVDQPWLWDIDSPYLYTARVMLNMSGATDERTTRFGFREISTANGQLLLNGKPIFLLSALDQDLYPETIYTVPSVEYLRDEFIKAQELGLNCLRCHIKPPDPRYLDLADEMGLLIWAEIPSWRTFHVKGTTHPHQLALHEDVRRRVEQTLVEMVRRDYNHPSLVIWTIVNEDWGTSLPLSASDRAWVAEMYDRCKALDPTRLVVDNSACFHAWGPNIHVKSDIDDFHIYANIPDQARAWEQNMDQFALRPLWTYSSQGDAQRTGHEPLILSEFGNWGLPSLKALRDAASGRDPAWFNIGAWWNPYEGEPGWPAGVDERFKRYGLDKIWEDYEAFAEATQWRQFEALRFEIQAMRRQPTLAGYVITEFTDAYWESNGLLDFYRGRKVYHYQFSEINTPDVIVPRVRRYAAWDDETIGMCVDAACYSDADWSGATLQICVDGAPTGQTYPVPPLKRGEVKQVVEQRVAMPRQVERSRRIAVELDVKGHDGQTLASDWIPMLVLPGGERRAAFSGQVAVLTQPILSTSLVDGPGLAPQSADPSGATPEGEVGILTLQAMGRLDLQMALGHMGYQTTREVTADTQVAVSNYPTADLLRWVRQGGDLLFIATGSSPFYWAQNRGGAYSGSWMTSFTWLLPGVHRRLAAAARPVGLPFMNVMPQRTILGLPVEDRAVQDDFLAGMIIGWVRHPSVHTVQFRYGNGRVIMTTFDIAQGLRRADPVAIAMVHDLVEHLTSDRCQPTLRANY